MRTVSIKVVNLLTLVLSTIFFMVAGFEVVFLKQKTDKIEQEFSQVLIDISQFNYNHLKGSNNTSVELPPQNVMFQNGTDAFLYAYNQFLEAKTYHVIARGEMINSVLGIHIKTDTKNSMIKFEDGSMLFEFIAYEEGNSYKRTGAQLIYYNKKSKRVYTNLTTIVNKTKDDLLPVYESDWLFQSANGFYKQTGILMEESIFNFNKQTIAEETYFNKTVIKGEVKDYQAQLITNATLAGKPYAKIIQYVAQAASVPNITKLKLNTVIDENGMLKHINIIEKFDLKTKITALVNKVVKCEADSIYYFVTIGGELLVEKPNVSNAQPW